MFTTTGRRGYGDRTWSYVIDQDISEQRLRALVADPASRTRRGIDRVSFRIERPGFRMPVEIAPGLLNEGNAALWLYYATASCRRSACSSSDETVWLAVVAQRDARASR